MISITKLTFFLLFSLLASAGNDKPTNKQTLPKEHIPGPLLSKNTVIGPAPSNIAMAKSKAHKAKAS